VCQQVEIGIQIILNSSILVPIQFSPQRRKGRRGVRLKRESRRESDFAFSLPAGRQVRLCGEPDFESEDQKKGAKEEE
jgi:hypothetical protein